MENRVNNIAKGIEKEIQATAEYLGLQYKVYPSLGKQGTVYGGSYANGGHFMWDPAKIEPVLNQTPFQTTQELVDFVAHNSYRTEPYRRVIDTLFGTPNIMLIDDKEGVDAMGVPYKDRGQQIIQNMP